MEVMTRLKQEHGLYPAKIWRQFSLNLLGRAVDGSRLVGNSFSDTDMLHVQNTENQTVLFCAYCAKLILSYLFNDYRSAEASAQLASQCAEGASAMALSGACTFYESLNQLALYPHCGAEEQRKILLQIDEGQRKLRLWARHGPMNHRSKCELVDAEEARVLGRVLEAMEHYDSAVEFAREDGFVQEEGIAAERAAEFYLALGRKTCAQAYVRDARRAYRRWGAAAKVDDLDRRYPDLLWVDRDDEATSDLHPLGLARDLDFDTFVKASLAISREIDLEKLLPEMMAIIVENAAAQRGLLVLRADGELRVEASFCKEPQSVSVRSSVPIDSHDGLSPSIVRYVTRTGEDVLLHDATRQGTFLRDSHVVRNQCKSVLCVPLKHEDEVTGVLYLENRLATYAFTRSRVALLEVLLPQVVISIENAKLHEALKVEMAQRGQAEEAMRDSEARFRGLVESSSDWIWEVNAEGVYTYASPQVEAILGYKTEEIIGESPFDLMPPEEATRIAEAFGACARTNEPVVALENVCLHKDGRQIVLETSGVPFLVLRGL